MNTFKERNLGGLPPSQTNAVKLSLLAAEFFILLTAFPVCFMQPLWADDLTDLYGDTIMLASGYEQLVKESPSSVYVINAKEIEAIGAITLEEVLATVPGIHVSYSNGFFPVYVIRGMGSETNSPVLMYLDGIAINSAVESSSHSLKITETER